MDACDVLIVGGGPAGSTCARALVQSGFDVVVLDKADFPRDKVCAGWITPAVVQEVGLDLADYATGRTLQPITGFRTGVMGGSQVCTRYGRVVSYGIRRCEFDHYLLVHSGARLRLRQPFATMNRVDDAWIVNDSIRARCVVGAGGHFCPVARSMAGDARTDTGVVLAQEVEFEMSADEEAECRVEPDVPELFFCTDLQGYAWCFRKGNFLNIGIGREGESQLAKQMAAFCELLHRAGRIPMAIGNRAHGHAYRLYRGRPRQASADGVLLIGDAAGLSYPQSGEGIRPAIESGLLAADVIAAARGDIRQAARSDYQRRLTDRFGRFRPQSAEANFFPNSWRQAVARKLLTSRWFTRHVVIDRWFLHRNQAPLPHPDGPSRPADAQPRLVSPTP
jgi:geranylgeranyl reductase family protein